MSQSCQTYLRMHTSQHNAKWYSVHVCIVEAGLQPHMYADCSTAFHIQMRHAPQRGLCAVTIRTLLLRAHAHAGLSFCCMCFSLVDSDVNMCMLIAQLWPGMSVCMWQWLIRFANWPAGYPVSWMFVILQKKNFKKILICINVCDETFQQFESLKF